MSFNDLRLAGLYMLIGLTLSIVLMPWRKKLSEDGEIRFIVGMSLMWALFILTSIGTLFRKYVAAWREYAANRD